VRERENREECVYMRGVCVFERSVYGTEWSVFISIVKQTEGKKTSGLTKWNKLNKNGINGRRGEMRA